MKTRNGFVSNSSSSSFILIYDRIWNYWMTDFEEDFGMPSFTRTGNNFLNHEEFAIIFEQGNSGDCEEMLLVPNQEIKDFIADNRLFENVKFQSLVDDMILLKKKIPFDSAIHKFDTVKDIRKILELAKDYSDDICFEYRKRLDASSITEDIPGESLELFKRFLKRSDVLEEK